MKKFSKQAWWYPALQMFSEMSAWIVGPLLLALLLGKYLDKIFHTKPWFFIGASIPEDQIIGNRIGWNLKKIPKNDLIVMYSDREPKGGQGEIAKTDTVNHNKIYVISFVGFVIIIFLLGVYLKKRKTDQKQNSK